MKLIDKIFAVILEEVNGYSREDAEKYASDNEGSEAYYRIEKLLQHAVIGWVAFNDEEPDEGDKIIVMLPPEQKTDLIVITYTYDFEWIDGSMWCKMPPCR